jgi:hypothetical protein
MPHQNPLPTFLPSRWSIFSSVHSWPAFGTTLRSRSRQKSLNKLPEEGYCKDFRSIFIEAYKNLKTIGAHSKSTDLI